MRNCTKCGGRTRVLDTIHDKNRTYRKRTCAECTHAFYTLEQPCGKPPIQRAAPPDAKKRYYDSYRRAAMLSGMTTHNFKVLRTELRKTSRRMGVDVEHLFKQNNVLTIDERKRLGLPT